MWTIKILILQFYNQKENKRNNNNKCIFQKGKWNNTKGQSSHYNIMFRTWENLAEKVYFLLEVSMRELLVGWLHEVLAGVEEVLQKEKHGD